MELLRRLWTGEELSHDGPYYAMENVKVHPAPTQPGGPPIVVAGRQEAAMHRAACLLGDGWMPVSSTHLGGTRPPSRPSVASHTLPIEIWARSV